MYLVIKNGEVVATHTDNQGREIADRYPDCEIAYWPGDYSLPAIEPDPEAEAPPEPPPPALDPRTNEQKQEAYVHQRKLEYPPIEELVVALWEKLVEQAPGADTRIEELEAQRQAVEAKYPEL